MGGGGSANAIALAMIDASKNYKGKLEFKGYVNDNKVIDQIEGYDILGTLKDVKNLIEKDFYFINAIGKIGFQKERIELIESLNIPIERFVTFVHPRAFIAPNIELGFGIVIMPMLISHLILVLEIIQELWQMFLLDHIIKLVIIVFLPAVLVLVLGTILRMEFS